MVVALCVFLLHRFLGGVGAVCARQDPRKKKRGAVAAVIDRRESQRYNTATISLFFPSSSSSSAPPTVSCQTHGERKYILYARSCIPIRYVTHSSLMEGASKLFSFFFVCAVFSLFFLISFWGFYISIANGSLCWLALKRRGHTTSRRRNC